MTWIIGTILAATLFQGGIMFLCFGFWPGILSAGLQGVLACIVAVTSLSESRYVPRNRK